MNYARTSTVVLACLALELPMEARGSGAESAASIRAIVDNAVHSAPNAKKRALNELRGLDPTAVPALIEVFSGRDLKAAEPAEISDEALFDIPPPPPWLQEVLLEALDAQDEKEIGRVLARFALEAELEERILCLQIAERMKGNRAVDAWISLIDGIPAIRLRSTFVSAPAERALTKIVHETPRAVNRIAKRLQEVETHLHPAIVRAISGSENAEALRVFSDLFGQTIDLDLTILREAGRLEGLAGQGLPEIEYRFLTESLQHDDPRYRAEAIVALARLECTFEIDAILGQLESEDRRVSRAALWALRHFSLQEWEDDLERWTEWWQQEQSWRENRFDHAISELDQHDPAKRLAIVDELSRHRVWAKEIGPHLERHADSQDDTFAERIRATLKQFD